MSTAIQAFFAWISGGVRALVRTLVRLVVISARLLARSVMFVFRSRPVRIAGAMLASGARVGVMTSALAGLALFVGWMGLRRVPPGVWGVRQGSFGQGIEAQDHPSGLYWSVRGLEEWSYVDRGTRMLSFAWETEGGNAPILDVRLRDGTLAQVAVALPYRVKPGEAHLLVAEGLKSAYPQRVRATAEKVLLQELAELSSDDLVHTGVRDAHADLILPKLNELLASFHVEAERVLIGQVMFAIEYEKKLQEKQLLKQATLLANAKTEVDTQREINELFSEDIETSIKKIRAEWDARIQAHFLGGKRRIVELGAQAHEIDRRRRAEAQAEASRLAAEGERALARAEGLKDELANEVYSSPGGRLLLARRAAENLNIKNVTLNSNDPRVPSVIDLDDLVHRLVGANAPDGKRP